MRKITAFLLLFTLLFSLLASSCTNGEPTDQNTTDTTVSASPSDSPEKSERKIYKHVLLVGVGSAGAFFSEADTPNIDRIFENGSVTYKARADYPTKSAPCWTSMLHGIEFTAHKVNEDEDTPFPSDSEFPSVFRAVKEQNPSASITVIGDSFFTSVTTEEDFGINTIEANGDFAVAESTIEYLNENNAPTLLFVCFDSPDSLGHDEGFGSPGHLAAIRNADTFFGYICDKYESQGILDDTLVIVTSNHGGFGKDHGSNKNEEKFVMFAASGESVIKNGTPEDMSICDVSAVVMYALGLDSPEGWTGRLPAGIFDGVGGGEREIYIDESSERYRKNRETPEKDSGKYVTDFIRDKALEYYLTLDNTTEDLLGNKVDATDDYYYVDGVFGKGLWLDNGYLTIPDYSNGNDAFTIAMWLKIGGVFADTPIITNRNSDDPNNSGFTLSLTGEKKTLTVLTMGNGSDSDERPTVMPTDYLDGWMHVIFTYSPEEGKAKITFDFGKFKEISLKDGMLENVFDNGSPLCIGYEPDSSDLYTFNGAIDELMQFDGYFNDSDVAALAEYYAK